MWLTVAGRPFRDGDMSIEELTSAIGEGFTTSGPTPGEFAAAIEEADTGEGVVVLTISTKMSGTHGSASLAARLQDGNRVVVMDTGTAAGAEGLVVLAACQAAKDGLDIEGVAAAAERAAEVVRLVATLPGLDYLAKSGRVPGAAAWAGRWLGVNPMFEFRNGHVAPLRPALSRNAARERMLDIWRRTIRNDAELNVAVMHAVDEDYAVGLLKELSEIKKPANAFVGSFSPVMVAHTGRGLVGLAWWWDSERTQSTAETTGPTASAS